MVVLPTLVHTYVSSTVKNLGSSTMESIRRSFLLATTSIPHTAAEIFKEGAGGADYSVLADELCPLREL